MCAACEKTRRFVARAWRTMRRQPPACIVYGCGQAARKDDHFCSNHWHALPLGMRQRWWRETGYSTRPPPQHLVEEVNTILRGHHG